MTTPDMLGRVSRLCGGQCRNNAGFEQKPPRARPNWRAAIMPHWYGYGDASETPLNDNRTALRPLAVLWVGLFAVACAVDALLPPPSSGVVPKDVAESGPALTPENAGAPGATTALIN